MLRPHEPPHTIPAPRKRDKSVKTNMHATVSQDESVKRSGLFDGLLPLRASDLRLSIMFDTCKGDRVSYVYGSKEPSETAYYAGHPPTS